MALAILFLAFKIVLVLMLIDVRGAEKAVNKGKK